MVDCPVTDHVHVHVVSGPYSVYQKREGEVAPNQPTWPELNPVSEITSFMKYLNKVTRSIVTPPGWDANLLQGYPPAVCCQ